LTREEPTERQREVLDAVLALLAEAGETHSTSPHCARR
jgi:hypothetical protein